MGRFRGAFVGGDGLLCFRETTMRSTTLAYHGKYGAPADILRDDDLNRDEKVRLLQQWRDDKKSYMRASEEGMPGEDRAELLNQIKDALLSLQENSAR